MLGRSLLMKASGARVLYPGYVHTYLDRVTAADVAAGNTLGLELGVTNAFNTCLQALVADGILGVSGGVLSQAASLIKASCFMMGARTLSGSLVPLAADMPAPTNVNLVAADYNRRLGNTGDGATKCLNAIRIGNADPQDDQSVSAHVTQLPTVGASVLGDGTAETGTTSLIATSTVSATRSRSATASTGGAVLSQPFFGISRSASASYTERVNGANRTISMVSQTPKDDYFFLFARSDPAGNPVQFANPRIAFYHIGRALDLAILDARITALSNAIQSAIAP